MDKNIIKPCSYVAGVDSPGMRALQKDFDEFSEHQIEKLDPYNANDCLPERWLNTTHQSENGIIFEGEKKKREPNEAPK